MAMSSPLVLFDTRNWDGGAVLANEGSAGSAWDLQVNTLHSSGLVVGDYQRDGVADLAGNVFDAMGVDLATTRWSCFVALRPDAGDGDGFIVRLAHQNSYPEGFEFRASVSMWSAYYSGGAVSGGTGYSWYMTWTDTNDVDGGGSIVQSVNTSGFKAERYVTLAFDPVADAENKFVADGWQRLYGTNTIDPGDAAGFAGIASTLPVDFGQCRLTSMYDTTPPGLPWKVKGAVLSTGIFIPADVTYWASYFDV